MSIPEPNYPIPIFTFWTPDGHKVDIYANGLVEGIEVKGIVNHLPLYLNYEQLLRFSKIPTIQGKADR